MKELSGAGGDDEGRLDNVGSASFDAAWYVRAYPDVSGSGLSPREHYEIVGRGLGRKPSPADGGSALVTRTDPLRHPSEEAPPIKVSILCVTYNHARFIAESLESFIGQKVSFPIEILVADDCSTDETQPIIAKYAARDDRIVPILRTVNLGPGQNFRDLASRARGQYVALCEGDDYWTDPMKLQLQADFLDSHPHHSLCFHPVEIVTEGGTEPPRIFPEVKIQEPTLASLVRGNFIQTNSVMYRWRYPGGLPDDYDPSVTPGDWHLHLLHAEVGRIGFIDRTMAVYRRHAGGMWSTSEQGISHRLRHIDGELAFFRDMKTRFGGLYAEHFHERAVPIFVQLAEHFIRRDMFAELALQTRRHRDFAPDAFRLLGFDLEALDPGDADALKRTITAGQKISVIVLTYNHVEAIEQCLRSVLMQEGPFELEIIVGDDCSSDGTSAIVAELAEKYPETITHLRSDQNLGMLKNLKRCIQRCTGNFIAFCEGDDYWLSKKKLLIQHRYLLRNPKSGMCFNWLLVEDVEAGSFHAHEEQSHIHSGVVSFPDIVDRYLTANFSCCFYRRETVEAVPDDYFDTPAAADWLFNLIVANDSVVGFNREVLSVYRRHEKGLWSGLSRQEQQSRIAAAKRALIERFGTAKGVDGKAVYFTVSKLGASAAPPGFRALLESPLTGGSGLIERGAIRLVGWGVHLLGKRPELVIRSGGKLTRHDLTERREDVVRSFERAERCYRDERCGFDVWVPYAGGAVDFDLGWAIEDEIVWWKRVRAEVRRMGEAPRPGMSAALRQAVRRAARWNPMTRSR